MFIHEELMRIHQKEMFDEAERNRLLSNHKPSAGRPRRIYARLMMWMGNVLLKIGTWLTLKFGDKTFIHESGAVDNRIQGIH